MKDNTVFEIHQAMQHARKMNMDRITLVDAGKALDKIQHQFMIEPPNGRNTDVFLKLKRASMKDL